MTDVLPRTPSEAPHPPEPLSPPSPTARRPPDAPSSKACLHCGTLLPLSTLPACPVCNHSGFLQLLRIPAHPLPLDLLHLLPSLRACTAAVPPSAVLTSLPVVADWLEQFPPSIHPTAFRITPPLPVGNFWTSFWSLDYSKDWTATAMARSPPPLFYWRHPSAGSPWVIGPDLPGTPTVVSTACSTCGRPAPHDASVELPDWTVPCFPRLLCVHPRRHAPFCICALAPRCSLSFQGLFLDGAVPVHVLPWSTLCAPQLPQLLLPPPPYLRTLPPPAQAEAELVQPTALTFMTHNWGGIALQTALARLWVEALSPDILCWHELWDLESTQKAIPPAYETLKSTANGAGTGFMIAWKRMLRRRPDEATLVFDGDHWIAALLPLWHVGRLLVLDVHLHPKIPYREWPQQVRRMEQLRRDLQPSYTFLAGDLNATDAPGTPLSSALSRSGPLHDYLRVLPPGTTTNHTTVKGVRRATAIDHVFIHGPVAEARHQLLSSRSSHAVSHAVIVVRVTLLTKSADARAWRRFRWRRASPSDMDAMAAALDLVWGWLTFTPALPDDYVASHHEVAAQLIPRPPDTRQLMHRLAQRHFLLGPGQLDQHLADVREAAEARGVQSRLDVLRSASITSATRTALHLPSPPLEPFSGILPRPEAVLPTREDRLNEVLRQSSAQTCNRHLQLDHKFFATHCDTSAWAPLRRPSLEPPMALLLAGLPPDHPDTPRAFLQTLNSPPLLTQESLAHRRLGKRTLAVSSDNVTRSLLFRAGGGVQQGLHHSLLQAEAGTPTVLNETVRYGIYKGKPSEPLPRHLARSFRPVDVESAASGTPSGIASDRLAANLEVSGPYTPVVFSYRTGLSSAFMVLVGRAAVYVSLLEHGSCAICDWDESDAYLRVVREFTHHLLHCLPHVWDYSRWAHSFYSRLVIRVITREGFAPPFSTGEGGNQGDAFAALHYQAPSHVLTLSLPVNRSVSLPLRLPGHSVPLPATTLVYSDDRRFLAPTLPEVVGMADASRDASRRAGRIVHPDKLEYFLARLGHQGITLERSPVPDTEMFTSTTPPELVGIPLLPEHPLLKAANKSLAAESTNPPTAALRPQCCASDPCTRLGFRSWTTWPAASCSPPTPCAPTSGSQTTSTQRPTAFPPGSTGPSSACPYHQAVLAPLTCPCGASCTYSHPTCGHHGAPTSWQLPEPTCTSHPPPPPPRAGWLPEGARLRQQLLPLEVALHPCASPTLHDALFHSSGDITRLRSAHHIVAATDGSQTDHRLGARVVLWHPDVGVFYRLWFGVQSCSGHSTDSEWLAKIALYFLLGDWSGTVLLATDSTAALTANMTRAPRNGTLLLLPFRTALVQLQARVQEVWLPAQHDTGATSLLAMLNAEADRLADHGALEARPFTVPWLPLFARRVVSTHQGRLILNPQKAAEAISRRARVLPAFPAAGSRLVFLPSHGSHRQRHHRTPSSSHHHAPPPLSPAPPPGIRRSGLPLLPPGASRRHRPPAAPLPPILPPLPHLGLAPPPPPAGLPPPLDFSGVLQPALGRFPEHPVACRWPLVGRPTCPAPRRPRPIPTPASPQPQRLLEVRERRSPSPPPPSRPAGCSCSRPPRCTSTAPPPPLRQVLETAPSL